MSEEVFKGLRSCESESESIRVAFIASIFLILFGNGNVYSHSVHLTNLAESITSFILGWLPCPRGLRLLRLPFARSTHFITATKDSSDSNSFLIVDFPPSMFSIWIFSKTTSISSLYPMKNELGLPVNWVYSKASSSVPKYIVSSEGWVARLAWSAAIDLT